MKTTFAVTPETAKFVAQLQQNAKRWDKAADRIVRRIAQACAKDVRAKIMSQAFPNVRLSDAWFERKKREGLDTRTLFATRGYYYSIKAERFAPRVWGVVCNNDTIRMWLEYGNRDGKQPPRPHWTPVLASYDRNFSKHFAREVKQELFGKP